MPIDSETRTPAQGVYLKQESHGTIAWWEHEQAWQKYNQGGYGQSATRMAERGGFDLEELTMYLGRPPETFNQSGEAHATARQRFLAMRGESD